MSKKQARKPFIRTPLVQDRLESLFDGLEEEPASSASPDGTTSSGQQEANLPATNPVVPHPLSLGYVADERQVLPSNSVLTRAGQRSLAQRQIVFQNAELDEPSAIALAVPFQEHSSQLLLEVLDEENQRVWGEDERLLVEQVASQLSLAMENANLFEKIQAALSETASLYQASAELNAAQTYDDILEALRSHTLLGAVDKNISLNLFDYSWLDKYGSTIEIPERTMMLARWGALPTEETKSSFLENRNTIQNVLAAVRDTLSPSSVLVIDNFPDDPRLDEDTRAYFYRNYQAHRMMFVPLIVAGRWIGFIHALYEGQIRFQDEEQRHLLALAGQAAIAIQNIHLLQESRRRADQLQTAAEIARDTSSTLALDTLLRRTVELLCERFNYDHASIFLLDEAGLNAIIREATGPAGEELKRTGHSLAVGSQSVIGYVTSSGQPLVLNDVTQEPIHHPNPLLPHTLAELGIPLKIGARVIGALDVQSNQVNPFTPDDLSVLQVLADQVAVAVDNARSYGLAQKAVEEMRELDRLKSQFLANMSHELRTPLNSIIGFSRVILKGIDGPINDLQNQDLSAIYHSGQHLLGLINDVLDLSKIEAGKMELAFEENVNLSELINSVTSTVTGLVKDKPIQLKTEIPPDLPAVRADPLKIRQVLLNLLSNAAKFTELGWILVTAEVQTGSNGLTEVVVRVTDTGTGIAPEDQPKLFQPFSQVDGSPTRKTGGSGLGLSICRRLIEMHTGHIGLESTPGKGTSVYFTLPISTPASSEDPASSEKIILAIESERQIIDLYNRYLSGHGYRVIALTDTALVMERVREVRPFAITLEVAIRPSSGSGPDGWQILRDLKQDPITKDIPVIICSLQGNGSRPPADQISGLNVAGYLNKPVLEMDLVKVLEGLE